MDVPNPATAPAHPDPFLPIVRTVLRSFRAADDVAMSALRSAGFVGTGPAAWYLLCAIPPGGGRASALARELGVTKQAVGQALKELERAGYVVKEADPVDRRALLVRTTPDGSRVAAEGEAALQAMENRWADELGRTRLSAWRTNMEELCSFLQDQARTER